MPARTVFSLEDLSTNIPKIFEQVQNTTANHQKNYVALHKLQQEAARHTEVTERGSLKMTGERAFEDTVLSMLSRALPVKKGAGVADRIIKFVGGYVKYMNEKAVEERRKRQEEQGDDDEDDEDTASRFVTRLLKFLQKGCHAKEKTVRYRVTQCLAEIVSHLGELDEDLYSALGDVLKERLTDREPLVRFQAVLAMAQLCGSEEPSDEVSFTDLLLDTLNYDSSADVRRAVLLKLVPTNERILDAILSRTRDRDVTVRKTVYSGVLEQHCLVTNPNNVKPEDHTEDDMGVTHPRVLSIANRELVVRNGLGDREESVKTACAKLLELWLDVVSPKVAEGQNTAEAKILAFLDLFDLVANSTAEDALTSVFQRRPDLLNELQFEDAFWDDLTPTRAFLARVFVDFCVARDDNDRLERALPVVTALAFRIQGAYNYLLAELQAEEEDMMFSGSIPEEREEARMEREFIIGEVLRLAVNLDYADEIGRRTMFKLVRDMISQNILPEGLVARCLDVLRKLSMNERDLIRVVVEVVHELRDNHDEDDMATNASQADDAESTVADTPGTTKAARPARKSRDDMTPEEKARADMIDMRCLSLCIGMLERVNGRFEENSTLTGLLQELIIPSLLDTELHLREKAIISLGLCCMIARTLAARSFELLNGQRSSGPEALRHRVLQILFDMLMSHERDFFNAENAEKSILWALGALDSEESDKGQAIICTGIAKLLAAGMVTDLRALQSLVIVYMSPETANNQELRQCLAYFLPVYCHSSSANQERMRQSFITVFTKLSEAYREWDGDEDMISPLQAGNMFVDWTDPQKTKASTANIPNYEVDESIQVNLATDIVKALFSDDLEREDKKILCQLLNKLYLPDEIDDDKIRTLKLLMNNLRTRRPIRDSVSKKAFTKFENAVSKKYEQQLADFNEEEYRQLEKLKDLFDFLDEIIPVLSDEEEEAPKGRKRRSVSVTSDSSTSMSEMSSDEHSHRKPNGKGKAKRRRLTGSVDESDDDDATERGSPSVEAPTRVLPRRSAASKSRAAVSKSLAPPPDDSEDEEDEDENEDEDAESTPVAKKRSHARAPSHESQADEDEDDDDDEPITAYRKTVHDSIMDDSEDSDGDDAEEVDDLL